MIGLGSDKNKTLTKNKSAQFCANSIAWSEPSPGLSSQRGAASALMGWELLFNNKKKSKQNGKFSFLQSWLNWLNKRQFRRWTSPSWAWASWGAGSPSFLRTRLSFLTWTYILDLVVVIVDLDLYIRTCCSLALLSLLTWTYISRLEILAVIENC